MPVGPVSTVLSICTSGSCGYCEPAAPFSKSAMMTVASTIFQLQALVNATTIASDIRGPFGQDAWQGVA